MARARRSQLGPVSLVPHLTARLDDGRVRDDVSHPRVAAAVRARHRRGIPPTADPRVRGSPAARSPHLRRGGCCRFRPPGDEQPVGGRPRVHALGRRVARTLHGSLLRLLPAHRAGHRPHPEPRGRAADRIRAAHVVLENRAAVRGRVRAARPAVAGRVHHSGVHRPARRTAAAVPGQRLLDQHGGADRHARVDGRAAERRATHARVHGFWRRKRVRSAASRSRFRFSHSERAFASSR